MRSLLEKFLLAVLALSLLCFCESRLSRRTAVGLIRGALQTIPLQSFSHPATRSSRDRGAPVAMADVFAEMEKLVSLRLLAGQNWLRKCGCHSASARVF